MKNIILSFVVLFVFANLICAQQFEKIWEFPERLIYVGDIDGDGVGEFAYTDEDNLITTFYDGSDLHSKWTIEDMSLYDNIFDSEFSYANPSYLKFPSIDFNGDGNRDLFFKTYADEYHYSAKAILIVDVVNNLVLHEFSDPNLNYPELLALTDINGDNQLELVFTFGGDVSKTCAYTTDLATSAIKQSPDRIYDYKLMQNYPNPFNPSTTIEYEISKTANVKINIYDVTGQLVRELVNEHKNTGNYSAIWNGRDKFGHMVASGTYYYQIQVDDNVQVKKMILLK